MERGVVAVGFRGEPQRMAILWRRAARRSGFSRRLLTCQIKQDKGCDDDGEFISLRILKE
jgi:hypothetical protein